MVAKSGNAEAITRNLTEADGFGVIILGSEDLMTWTERPDLELANVEQTNVPAGFTRRRWALDATKPNYFLRIEITGN